MNTDRIIDRIIASEGGFVDHPSDRGGPTKYGITMRTLAESLGRTVSLEDVLNISENQARTIYDDMYIQRPKFDCIDDPRLQHLVIDSGVLHGRHRASQWLQSAARTHADGIVGPKTLKAVNNADASVLFDRVLASRLRSIGAILSRRRDQVVFATGWLNRAASFLDDGA